MAPPVESALPPELQLDYVASVPNAATVVAALHQGEKRLVFADSRRTVESLALALQSQGTDTYVSHSSLSVGERRRSETAFAESRDCVIVATSTLELGVDVGDLDRVLQVGAPRTVASFLQRLGRTGRRPGAARSMVFLATSDDELLRGTALLQLWSEGYVEPVVPPPTPRHVLAQQLPALCLQHGRVGSSTWDEALRGLGLATAPERAEISAWLTANGHLDSDSGLLFVGPAAERRYGRKNFLELLSVFTSDPEFVVLHGQTDIGSVDPMVLTRKVAGPRLISLAGRAWKVTYIDWKRRRAYVEPSDQAGVTRWSSAPQPLSYELTDAMRRVLLGVEPAGVALSKRAVTQLASVRTERASTVDESCSVIATSDNGQLRWWTYAGARANSVLATALTAVDPTLVDEVDRFDNRYLRLRGDASAGAVQSALRSARSEYGPDLGRVVPSVSEQAVKQLKFAELLPPAMAVQTLAARSADNRGAARVAARAVVDGHR